MTRKEAIEALKHIIEVANKSDCNIKEIDGTDEEALEMAIKALEQEPCDDCISRAEAVDSLLNNTGLDGYDLAQAIDAIENKEKLPSVTPVNEQLLQQSLYVILTHTDAIVRACNNLKGDKEDNNADSN